MSPCVVGVVPKLEAADLNEAIGRAGSNVPGHKRAGMDLKVKVA
jgi:hypothetical protein